MLKKIYNNGGNYAVFFLIFNLVFILFGLSLKYAMPFVISILLTAWLYPLSDWIYRKTKINKSLINITCILLSLALIIGVIFLIGTGMFKESASMVNELSKVDVSFISEKLAKLKEVVENVPPDMLDGITKSIQGITGYLTSFIGTIGSIVVKTLSFIPAGIINTIIIVLSTYYLMRDYKKIAEKFENTKICGSNIPKKIIKRVNSIILNYMQSYGILLAITFVECMIVFSIFDVKYKFTLAVICVILDIMPIIGSACIYIPIAIIFLLKGKILSAIWILCLYGLFIVVRNVMEPKLLSKSLEIHPVLILISIYVGVALGGIMGVIYFIFLIAYYKLLKELQVI